MRLPNRRPPPHERIGPIIDEYRRLVSELPPGPWREMWERDLDALERDLDRFIPAWRVRR